MINRHTLHSHPVSHPLSSLRRNCFYVIIPTKTCWDYFLFLWTFLWTCSIKPCLYKYKDLYYFWAEFFKSKVWTRFLIKMGNLTFLKKENSGIITWIKHLVTTYTRNYPNSLIRLVLKLIRFMWISYRNQNVRRQWTMSSFIWKCFEVEGKKEG